MLVNKNPNFLILTRKYVEYLNIKFVACQARVDQYALSM